MLEMVKPKELKIGDKINGYESGWLTVKAVENNGLYTVVTVDTMFGEKELRYLSYTQERIQVVRA